MSVLIVYSTKYGFTDKCVDALKQQLQDNTIRVVNLSQEKAPDPSGYDKVIVGGSIYMGMLRKKVKQFCVDNKAILLDKKLGLFITCSSTGDIADNQLKNNFDSDLYSHAIAKECLGGAMNMEKAKFLDRMIIKMVTKADKSNTEKNDGLLEEKVTEYSNTINIS